MRPKTLRTRAKRRLTEKEQAIIGTLYLGVCQAFEKELFAEQEISSFPNYDTLFTKYDRKWKRACQLVEPRLKFLSADPDIFAKEYQSTIAA